MIPSPLPPPPLPATRPGRTVARHPRSATLAGAAIGVLSAGVLVASGSHLPSLPDHPSDLPTWVHRHGSAVAVATALRMVGLALVAYGSVVVVLALLARRVITLRVVVASLPGNWARRLARSLLGTGLGAGLLGAPSTLAVVPAAAEMTGEPGDQAPARVVVDLHHVAPAATGPPPSPPAKAATMIPLGPDGAPGAMAAPDPTAPSGPAPPGSPTSAGSSTSPAEWDARGRPDEVAHDTAGTHSGARTSETVRSEHASRTERASATDEGLRAHEGLPTGVDPATAAPPAPSRLVMRALDSETEEIRPAGAQSDRTHGDRAVERVDRSSGDLDSPAADHLWEVALGDHLWAIAAENLAEVRPTPSDDEVLGYWRRLVDTNQDRLVDPTNPDLLIPGQVLVLPPVN